MKNIHRELEDFAGIAYANAETELGRVELAWADFVAAVRTGVRCNRAPVGSPNRGLRCDGLLRVHETLSIFEARWTAGDRKALLAGIVYCAEENVPLPYWIANAFLALVRDLRTNPKSLHTLFGLDDTLRASGARGKADREDLRNGAKLYRLVASLRGRNASMSASAAIRDVLARHKFPFTQRKAYALFKRIDEKQQPNLKVRNRIP